MSSMTKTAIALIVLIVVILVGWLWYVNSSGGMPTAGQSAPITPIPPTPNGQGATPIGGVTAPSDSSDAAIDQDMTSIGGQVNGLNADSANAGQNSAVPQLQ